MELNAEKLSRWKPEDYSHEVGKRHKRERQANKDGKYQDPKPSMTPKKSRKQRIPPDDPASQTPTPTTVFHTNVVVGGTDNRNATATPKTVVILIEGGRLGAHVLRNLIYSDDEGEDHSSSSQDDTSDSEDDRDPDNSGNQSEGADEDADPDVEMVDAPSINHSHRHKPSRNHHHKHFYRQRSKSSRPRITVPAPASVCSMTPSDSISRIQSAMPMRRVPFPAKEDSLVAMRSQLRAKTLSEIYQAVDEVADKIIGLTTWRMKVRAPLADPDLPEDLYLQKRKWLVVAQVIKEVLEEKTGLHDALLGGKWWWWMSI